ncbi:uncharacterized protein B0I36DRAFT_324584 [Microdochium trichocladiopsis]|uniref:Uncharacterized protein n=1 Tax=Microdochium trichocladiopsis TaxID=1682393 RepID=A0A9P9BP84_9PEZI|nr:uncharacterized protein B0I36DRAFT_324584 [Microdochium trichocladiopsis]KAH7028795.1 hypothetical protein B0I36DRAFT_324584 [Microdochium trichocladiopsis]
MHVLAEMHVIAAVVAVVAVQATVAVVLNVACVVFRHLIGLVLLDKCSIDDFHCQSMENLDCCDGMKGLSCQKAPRAPRDI